MELLENGRAAIRKAWETALIPFHALTSKPAQKAYLGTFLLASTSLFLLAISTTAYLLFYWNFVPQVSVERTIFLEFGSGGHPHGTARLDSSLTSLQPYDISLLLHLPRTPSNFAAGNFMLELSLLSSQSASSPSSTTGKILPNLNSNTVLARSRRPAILTYASRIVDTASTLSGLPLYILGWKTESEVLEVPMFEGVEFPRGGGGANVPQSVELVVESEEKMQVYDVGLRVVARFGGLRWIMYYHRILSFVVFTSIFWTSSMISALMAWLVLSSYFSTRSTTAVKKEEPTIKSEPEESELDEPSLTEGLSDTPRTFPTLGRHMPLHFTGRREDVSGVDNGEAVKEEDVVQSMGIQPLSAEADDEDDDFEAASGFKDSGIGTSLDEGQRAQLQRRRKLLFGNRE
ncbi:MAG: hypothetical protein Q9201_005686 [Fulgogasparrea decipioides]